MLKVSGSTLEGLTRIGRCNFSNEITGEARVNLPLELSLPADPHKWTKRQAQNWLCWLREANDLEELDITEFNVDGAGLCNLSPQLIENMVGIRGGNIFRSSLDLLQSTAALVGHSPAVDNKRSPFETPSPDTRRRHSDTRHMSPQMRHVSREHESATPGDGAPESPALTITPPPLSLHLSQDRLPLHYQTPGDVPTFNRSSVITSEDIARLHPVASTEEMARRPVASTGEMVRRPVTSVEEMARRPVASVEEMARRPVLEQLKLTSHPEHLSLTIGNGPAEEQFKEDRQPPAKIERRRSSDSSVEGEEENLNRNYFPNSKTERRLSSNGIDCGRQGVTLWQFILELLADESCQDVVAWTENPLEFKVINSKEMAVRWGTRKNRPKMNYDKLSRALRYYYRKNLIQHVPGKRQVYFFVEHPESLDFTQLLNTSLATHPSRNRKHSAFSQVTKHVARNTAGVKRSHSNETQGDILTEIKRGRTLEPLSMLGYTGQHNPPQLLTLQSPFTQQLPPFFLQQGSIDLMRLSEGHPGVDPRSTLEQLMISSPPCVITSLPQLSGVPPETAIQKISVLDTGCVKPAF